MPDKTAAQLIEEAKDANLDLGNVTAENTVEEIEAAIEKAKKKTPERKPPWDSDEDFDAQRAAKLIENLRDDLDKLKADRDELRSKVDEHEDATKSEQQKLEERATKAEARAAAAEQSAARLRVALNKGLTETQAKRLVGESEEDLEKDADELLSSFRSEEEGDDDRPRRPRERLRPGAAPAAEPEKDDPASLAEPVSRGW